MRVVWRRGAAGLVRLRRTAADGSLPGVESVLGCLLDDAVSPRRAASTAIAFFGMRRASGVTCAWACGVGQTAQQIAMDSRGAACPVRLLPGLPWLRSWLGGPPPVRGSGARQIWPGYRGVRDHRRAEGSVGGPLAAPPEGR